MAFAWFRFEDLTGSAVDDFGADDCLLIPSERIVDYIFVGKVAAEERLGELY